MNEPTPEAPPELARPAPIEVSQRETTSSAWMLFLVFLGVAVFLFLPAFSGRSYNSDEAYLATQAQELNRGGHLYVDTVDRKPPVVPLLYAASFRITGTDDIRPLRILAILANVATALLLAAEATRRFRDRRAGLIAGLLFLGSAAAFFAKDAQTANFEVFMLPLIVASVLVAHRGRPFASGALLALATLTKQTAAITILPLAWIIWRQRDRADADRSTSSGTRDRLSSRVSGLSLLAAGLLLPIAMAAVVFGPQRFVHWVFTSNDSYLDVSGAVGFVISLMFRQTQYFLVGHLVLVLLAVYAWRRRRQDADLWLWTLSGVIGAASGFRFFGHYFLQVLPPLCLLATGTLLAMSKRVLAAVAVAVVAPVLWFGWSAFSQSEGRTEKTANDLAAYVQEHTAPGTRVLVWGHLPEVYWYSNRPAAVRFATTGFLTGLSGGRPSTRIGVQYATPEAWADFEADLRQHPPALIFDLAAADVRDAATAPPERFPRFGDFLARGYDPIAVVDGVVVYGPR